MMLLIEFRHGELCYRKKSREPHDSLRYGLVPENEEDEVEYASSHLPEVKVLLDQSSNPRRCNFALRAHATLRSSDYHGSERAMMKNHVYSQMILSRSLSSDTF